MEFRGRSVEDSSCLFSIYYHVFCIFIFLFNANTHAFIKRYVHVWMPVLSVTQCKMHNLYFYLFISTHGLKALSAVLIFKGVLFLSITVVATLGGRLAAGGTAHHSGLQPTSNSCPRAHHLKSEIHFFWYMSNSFKQWNFMTENSQVCKIFFKCHPALKMCSATTLDFMLIKWKCCTTFISQSLTSLYS